MYTIGNSNLADQQVYNRVCMFIQYLYKQGFVILDA